MHYHPEHWKPPETSEPFYDAVSGAVWHRHSGRAVAAAWAIVAGLVLLTLLSSLVAAPTADQSQASVAKTRNHAVTPGV
jgi:hypothetical protein